MYGRDIEELDISVFILIQEECVRVCVTHHLKLKEEDPSEI